MGVRASIIPILVSYFQKNRKMIVKFGSSNSSQHDLPGAGPQGTLLGGIEYLVNSNDNADFIEDDKKIKYVDDLLIHEFVAMKQGLY